MRIYKNCKEAVKEIERDMYEMGLEVQGATVQDKNVEGDENYFTKELSPYDFMILYTSDKLEFINYLFKNDELERDKIEHWAHEEFKERISRVEQNPGEAWKIRADVWDEFLHEGKFAYVYSGRIAYQLDRIIQELKEKPATRQGIISIHNNATDLEGLGGINRVPCSMHYQFILRKDKLDLIYVMRSSDFLTHFANDNFLAIALRDHIAEELGVMPGKYTFFTGSLHCFYKDLKKRGIIF